MLQLVRGVEVRMSAIPSSHARPVVPYFVEEYGDAIKA